MSFASRALIEFNAIPQFLLPLFDIGLRIAWEFLEVDIFGKIAHGNYMVALLVQVTHVLLESLKQRVDPQVLAFRYFVKLDHGDFAIACLRYGSNEIRKLPV